MIPAIALELQKRLRALPNRSLELSHYIELMTIHLNSYTLLPDRDKRIVDTVVAAISAEIDAGRYDEN